MIDINLLHLLLLLFFKQRACHVGCSAGSTRPPPTPNPHPPPSREGGEMPALRSLQCWKRRLSLSLTQGPDGICPSQLSTSGD